MHRPALISDVSLALQLTDRGQQLTSLYSAVTKPLETFVDGWFFF